MKCRKCPGEMVEGRTSLGSLEFTCPECGYILIRSETPEEREQFHYVMGDITPYKSPIDGTVISSRAQHKAHKRQHGVIEVGNEKLSRPMNKPYNPGDIKRDLADAFNR